MSASDIVLRRIEEDLKNSLSECGFMFRIFSRTKSNLSVEKKLEKKKDKYKKNGEKMQDLIALRITLYFTDDVDIVYKHLRGKSNYVNESVNKPGTDQFGPVCLNLVMRVPKSLHGDIKNAINETKYPDLIDDTYEIQIRTILSEGWHEVEHDLRYKCKEDWKDYPDESRLLNGIFASLESNEWSMLVLFDRLSYSHYKKGNWNGMLRNKLRIRFANQSLSKGMIDFFKTNKEIAKKIFRANRSNILQCMLKEGFKSPLTYDTAVHLINHIEIKNKDLAKLEDPVLKEELDSLFGDV